MSTGCGKFRKCFACKITKESVHFSRGTENDGLYYMCKSCCKIRRYEKKIKPTPPEKEVKCNGIGNIHPANGKGCEHNKWKADDKYYQCGNLMQSGLCKCHITPPEKAPQSEPSKEVGVKDSVQKIMYVKDFKETCFEILPDIAGDIVPVQLADIYAFSEMLDSHQRVLSHCFERFASQAETIAKLEKQVEEMRKQPEELPQCGNCDELEENCTCKS